MPPQIAEVGQIILNFASLIPAGMIVFVPSYAFLNSVVAAWTKSGLWQKMAAKKKV
jgi:chromosome transmission fidelity protein 1